MKFAHMGDCHLGGWRQPELSELNFRSFQYAVDKCIREKVEFILISGDLFDSAYPIIDTLKDTFREFRKIKDAGIPVFLIAGSHDFSASGKTFLDVLEKAGFCKNVSAFEEKEGKIILQPTLYKNFAIFGYPGKKSSLEVEDIAKIKLHDAPGLFRILMLHTAIRGAIGSLPIKSVDESLLPKVDYIALSHLHIRYKKDNLAYSGPIFPNNLPELEELQGGCFQIYENGKLTREEIKLKKIVSLDLEITNTLDATEQIILALDKEDLRDRVLILKLHGIIESGKNSDIDFNKIEEFVKKKGVYSFLKSTTKLLTQESEFFLESTGEALESQIIKNYEQKNPSKFNELIPLMIKSLQIEKQEDEKSVSFEDRLLSEIKKIIQI